MDLISIKISYPSTILLLLNTAKSMNYVTLKTSHDSIIAESETRHCTEPATLSFFIIKDNKHTVHTSALLKEKRVYTINFSSLEISNQKRSISDREDPIISFTTNVISKNTLGGRSGNRTHTPLLELDFESGASTNSAIRP